MNDALQIVADSFVLHKGRRFVRSIPMKPSKVTFFTNVSICFNMFQHHKCFNSENNNRVIRTFHRPLFCTPADNLPILADIQPAELPRMGVHCLSAPCHGPRASAPLSLHLCTYWECTAPQIERLVCAHCTTATVLLTTTELWGAQGGSPMECEEVGLHFETPNFHPRHRHPPSWNGPSKDSACPS